MGGLGRGGCVKGATEMIATLKRIAAKFPDRVAAALYTEAQVIMTASKRLVPVETGILRASGQVAMPERNGRRISVTLSYGGAAEPYAIVQHESLDFKHPNGGQAKFLEQPLNEAMSDMNARLAARLQLGKE